MYEVTESSEPQFPVAPQSGGALVDIESARVTQEVQAAMIVAKRFPRDQNAAYLRIMEACKRKTLAEVAQYAYPRGGAHVTGPSIRLAEVILQNWGNAQSGIRELSQKDGISEVQAFAWDLETNNLQSKTFQVKHERYTKKGTKKLTEQRDIYELVANLGARRLRACILSIVPGDIVEAATKQCTETLKKGLDGPIEDKVRDMLQAFAPLGVTKEMVEKRLGHNLDAIIVEELIKLRQVYQSLKDGMASREQFFDVAPEHDKKAQDLEDRLMGDREPDPAAPAEFICETCGFVAKTERGLKKHITQQHTAKEEPEQEQTSDGPGIPESTDTNGGPTDETPPRDPEDESWWETFDDRMNRLEHTFKASDQETTFSALVYSATNCRSVSGIPTKALAQKALTELENYAVEAGWLGGE